MSKLTTEQKKNMYDLAITDIIGTSNDEANEIGKVMCTINAANKKGLKLIRTQLKIYVRYCDYLIKK